MATTTPITFTKPLPATVEPIIIEPIEVQPLEVVIPQPTEDVTSQPTDVTSEPTEFEGEASQPATIPTTSPSGKYSKLPL